MRKVFLSTSAVEETEDHRHDDRQHQDEPDQRQGQGRTERDEVVHRFAFHEDRPASDRTDTPVPTPSLPLAPAT